MEGLIKLKIEKTLLDRAKAFAEKKNQNLNDLIINYLKTLPAQETKTSEEYTPIVKAIKGSHKTNRVIDYKEEISQIVSDKYLK
jgi:hypothetical protein